jgi:hypothetical protein
MCDLLGDLSRSIEKLHKLIFVAVQQVLFGVDLALFFSSILYLKTTTKDVVP